MTKLFFSSNLEIKENNLRLLCSEMQHIVEVLNTLATAFKHTSHLFHLWELPIVFHNGVQISLKLYLFEHFH